LDLGLKVSTLGGSPTTSGVTLGVLKLQNSKELKSQKFNDNNLKKKEIPNLLKNKLNLNWNEIFEFKGGHFSVSSFDR
jgi:hypothetical protein